MYLAAYQIRLKEKKPLEHEIKALHMEKKHKVFLYEYCGRPKP